MSVKTLQQDVSLTDQKWEFNSALPPIPAKVPTVGKCVLKLIKFSTEGITISWVYQEANRIVSYVNSTRFVLVSFANLRFEGQSQQTATYIERVLKNGIVLNREKYLFCGNSNSQLKSRTCYMYSANETQEILNFIDSFGDFNKIPSVAKRAKRIGLLFTSAKISICLNPSFVEDIADVECDGNIFTDGCGFISKEFANTLARTGRILFRDKRYCPCVFQVRYKGYKGVLLLNPELPKPVKVQFRDSMRKFKDCRIDTLSVIGYSQPYEFGKLNGEFVTLLSCLGITDDVFLRKQDDYINFLYEASHYPTAAFNFLCYKNRTDIAENLVLQDGCNSKESERLWKEIRKLVQEEWKKSYGKRDAERVHIMIPDSRLLYGVCDPTGKLNEHEVFVRFTCERRGPVSLDGAQVVVGRNPCLHPGDIRKFRAVELEELNHLVDCIVFSTHGKIPQPAMMSGGDLDGDKFFVCWDKDLIPMTEYEPYSYSAAKQMVKRQITYETLVSYFAHYTNASLGRVKNLYLKWLKCSTEGAGSKECQELNALFSSCVDGENIKVPKRLESPPETNIQETVLYKLCENIKEKAHKIVVNEFELGTEITSIELMEHIISTDDPCMNEIELFQLTHRFLRKFDKESELTIDDFLPYFDFCSFTSVQKHWILRNLIYPDPWVGPMFNSLYSSELITEKDLHKYNLGHPDLHWKKYYSSLSDNCLRLSSCLAKAMMQFKHKLLILRVNEHLAVAIYVARQLSVGECIDIHGACKLFTFVSSAADLKVMTDINETNYKLDFDGNVFQLYQKVKTATLIFFLVQHPEKKKKSKTSGLSEFPELSVSIALGKLGKVVQEQVGKVQRETATGMEIYVISNRDRIGQQILDITMNQVDTTEIKPRILNTPNLYEIPNTTSVVWEIHPNVFQSILVKDCLTELNRVDKEKLPELFLLCLQFSAKEKLMNIVEYILRNLINFTDHLDVLNCIIDFIPTAPFISLPIVSVLDPVQLKTCKPLLICKGLIQSANEYKDVALDQFHYFLNIVILENQFLSKAEVIELVKSIAFGIRDAELARDFLFEMLQDNKKIIQNDSQDIKANDYFETHILAQSMNYINEVSETCPSDLWGSPEANIQPVLRCLTIKPVVSGTRSGEAVDEADDQMYEADVRIDVSHQVRNNDHIRFRASSAPTNQPLRRLTVIDAIVKKANKGSVQFCFQQCVPVELETASWDMFHCAGTTTFESMLEAVKDLVEKKHEATLAFNAIILDSNMKLQQPWVPVNENQVKLNMHRTLNESQSQSILKALNNQITLIWGPPGTGKTTVVVQIVIQHLRNYPDFKILVTASTHNAVDNVLERLVKELKESNEELGDEDLIRVTSEVSKVDKSVQKWTLDAFVGTNLGGTDNFKAKREALKKLKKARIVFSTCSGAGVGILRNDKLKYQVVIVDEASQITEPNCLIPIVKGSKKVILVGDHLQLRPTVTQLGVAFNCDKSLFEKLYKDSHPGIIKEMLIYQYRMHPILMRFPSERFYRNRLVSGVDGSSRQLKHSNFPWPELQLPCSGQATQQSSPSYYPLVFVNCMAPESFAKSKYNRGQAECVVQIVKMLRQNCTSADVNYDGTSSKNITVVTPYSAQMKEIKSKIPKAITAEVVTIDGFQGRESDIIVFSTVRSNNYGQLGFLEDERRMNVALTRSRFGLIIVGNRETLSSNICWNELLNVCRPVDIQKK